MKNKNIQCLLYVEGRLRNQLKAKCLTLFLLLVVFYQFKFYAKSNNSFLISISSFELRFSMSIPFVRTVSKYTLQRKYITYNSNITLINKNNLIMKRSQINFTTISMFMVL